MVDNAGVSPEAEDDWFLRRIASANAIKRHANDVQIKPKAFRGRGMSLSLTLQDNSLQEDLEVKKYQLAHRLPSGDLPGICRVSRTQLTRKVQPPLEPRYDPDEADMVYGHLHYVTDPPNDDQCQLLAKIATYNRFLVDFQPHS